MMTSQLRSRWGGFMVGSKIALDPRESRELQRRTRATTIAVRDRQRAEMILLRAAGMTQAQIAVRLGVSRVTVNDWCQRFLARRLAGLDDAPGRGRKPSLPPEAVRIVLEKAVTPPAMQLSNDGARGRISQASVQRPGAATTLSRISRGPSNCPRISSLRRSSGR